MRAHGIARTLPEIVTYGITADEAHRFGLPCGGTIELAIEPLSAHSRIAELLQRLARPRAGGAPARPAHRRRRRSRPAARRQRCRHRRRLLTTMHGPRWRLLIIGAGQLSRFLAQIASGMDYHVTVCDPREEYRAGWDGARRASWCTRCRTTWCSR